MNLNPPHEVSSFGKWLRLTIALLRGETLPPIVVQGNNALTGSHRLAAYASACSIAERRLDLPCPAPLETVEVSDEIYNLGLKNTGADSRLTALYQELSIIARHHGLEDLNAALVDQF